MHNGTTYKNIEIEKPEINKPKLFGTVDYHIDPSIMVLETFVNAVHIYMYMYSLLRSIIGTQAMNRSTFNLNSRWKQYVDLDASITKTNAIEEYRLILACVFRMVKARVILHYLYLNLYTEWAIV